MQQSLLTPEELAILAEKVKAGTATNEETIQYQEIVNGLLDEYIMALKSMPTDEQLATQE